MQEENSKEKVYIKGPKKTMTKLSSELFDELAKEGFARVEGLGTFRKSGSSFEFIPTNDGNASPSSQRTSSKIVDLSEEDNPYWLNNSVGENRARIPNAGNLEFSDVLIPSGRTQQKVLQDRYEKHKKRREEASRNKKQKNYRIAFGIVGVLAIAMLSSPLWMGENGSDIGNIAGQELILDKASSSSEETNTRKVSTSSSDPSAALKVETATQDDKDVQAEITQTTQGSEEIREDSENVAASASNRTEKEQGSNSSQDDTSDSRVQKTEVIKAIGPELGKKDEESDKKKKVKVTPLSHLKAEVAVGNQFAIVAASMQSIPSAKKMVEELRQKGITAEIVVSPVNGKTYYRVVLGRFKTSAEASEANKALGGEHWVTRLSFASQLLSI